MTTVYESHAIKDLSPDITGSQQPPLRYVFCHSIVRDRLGTAHFIRSAMEET
jgi:hypothetical protein